MLAIVVKVRQYVKLFDIYTEDHNYIKKTYMYLQKTFIGGIFTIAFVIAATFLVASSVIRFWSDNILETKAMVPL